MPYDTGSRDGTHVFIRPDKNPPGQCPHAANLLHQLGIIIAELAIWLLLLSQANKGLHLFLLN